MNSAEQQPAPLHETPSRRFPARFALFAYFAAALLAFAPALTTPFFLDDYLHASMVEGSFPVARSPFDLYDFVDDADRGPMLERGLLPWWTHPRLTIRFLRPLSSALLWVDHKTFGENPLPMHLHSLAWWIAAVLGARALFRRWFSARVARIGAIVFAISPCHAMPLGWLANREALLSLAFGTFALAAYARFRDEPRPRVRAALAATGLFALALLGGGEYALCFGGYVVAIELARGRRREPLLRRAASWLPFALPAAAYLAVRARLGYGTVGSGFYSDPLHDPAAFLRKVPWRATALVAEGWLTFDATYLAPWQRYAVACVVALVTIGIVWAVKTSFAALDADRRRTATWLLVGSLFALGPVLAVVPSPRLLGVATLGIAPVVAIVLDHAWFSEGPEDTSRAGNVTRLVAVALGFAHFVHGPVTGWLDGRQLKKDAIDFGARVAWLRDNVADPKNAEIGVVRGMAPVFFVPFGIDPRSGPPARWCVLAQTGHVLVLRRDARTLELVVAEDRSLYPAGDGNLYRSEDAALRVGDTFERGGVRATVLAVGEEGPRRVRLDLERVDDAQRLAWMNDGVERIEAAELPAPGFGAPFDP